MNDVKMNEWKLLQHFLLGELNFTLVTLSWSIMQITKLSGREEDKRWHLFTWEDKRWNSFTLQSIYLNVTIEITGNAKNMEKRLENVEKDIKKLNDKMEEILTTMRQLKGKGTDSDSNTNIQKISDKVEGNSKQIMQVSL